MTKRRVLESLPTRDTKRKKIAEVLVRSAEDADVPDSSIADLDDVITPTVQELDERTYSNARGRRKDGDLTDPDGWVGIFDDS